jgi:hypothetical protein
LNLAKARFWLLRTERRGFLLIPGAGKGLICSLNSEHAHELHYHRSVQAPLAAYILHISTQVTRNNAHRAIGHPQSSLHPTRDAVRAARILPERAPSMHTQCTKVARVLPNARMTHRLSTLNASSVTSAHTPARHEPLLQRTEKPEQPTPTPK